MRDLRHDEIQEALQGMDITPQLLETIQHDGIDMTVFSILTQAISAYFVTLSLKSLSTTANFVVSNAFLLSSLCKLQVLLP